jgi:uncharacterized membrane protein YhaH (DUF805 family)
MDWGFLFFKFAGRINRAKFWIAVLIFTAINIVLAIIGYALDESVMFQAVNGMIGIVVLISSIAVGIKRLHDRDKSGWYLVLFYIVPGVLATIGMVVGMTAEDGSLVTGLLFFAAAAIGIWAFIELGCLRGTVGSNRFGPDPLPSPAGPVVQ